MNLKIWALNLKTTQQMNIITLISSNTIQSRNVLHTYIELLKEGNKKKKKEWYHEEESHVSLDDETCLLLSCGYLWCFSVFLPMLASSHCLPLPSCSCSSVPLPRPPWISGTPWTPDPSRAGTPRNGGRRSIPQNIETSETNTRWDLLTFDVGIMFSLRNKDASSQ